MRDFPVFTTENGVGSLVLHNVPYWSTAYISVHSASDPTNFIKECVDFCKAVGADKIFGTGHELLKSYPYHTSVIKMTLAKESFASSDAYLFPVQENTAERWRKIYNDKMISIPNASYMTANECAALIKKGEAYFVHKDGELLGIGAAGNGIIKTIASLRKGKGVEIVNALAQIIENDMIELEVASSNDKAISLYKKIGFLPVQEISRWYKIL